MSGPVSIDSKGYGKIYKAVMRNPALPLLAKTIYAYFCAYAGCGCTAFPKRDKILRDLQINKDTYTKHLSRLVEDGYISKERTAAGNLFTIRQSVPAYAASPSAKDAMTDLLTFESVAAHGFGTVPKLVMLDRNLTAQAKAIYAYFASFAGAGTTAFPRRATIMRELKIKSLGTYYQHFNLLVQYGYLSVEQRKSEGRFDICIYHLNEAISPETAPTAAPPKRRNGMSEKSEHGEDGIDMGLSASWEQSEQPMSEKTIHGGKRWKTHSAMSEKPLSEKQISEKTEHRKNGHANNNNIVTRNSYFMTEQVYDHQRSPMLKTPTRAHYTPEEVKRRIGYEKLQAEAEGWGSLMKTTLGMLDTPEEESRYHRVVGELLAEFAYQLTDAVNQARNPDQIFSKIEEGALAVLFDELLGRWDEIRCVKAYVAASLKNLLGR